MVVQMGTIAAESLEARALMAIKVSYQCVAAGNVDLNTANVEALTSRIKEWFSAQAQFVKDKIDESPLKRIGHRKSAAYDMVQQRLDLMNKKVDADYAFLAMRAATERAASDNAASPAPIISMTGPVSVIQAGNQNIANVSQRLDEGMVEALRGALMSMSEQLAQDGDHPKVKEDVDLAIAELGKSEPNRTVLAGLMTGIKETVEFTPKLQKFAETIAPYLPMLGLS